MAQGRVPSLIDKIFSLIDPGIKKLSNRHRVIRIRQVFNPPELFKIYLNFGVNGFGRIHVPHSYFHFDRL